MANYTANQRTAIARTNKYGVVYNLNPSTARSLVNRGLIAQHTNFYGKTHGFKLTTEGFAAKREIGV